MGFITKFAKIIENFIFDIDTCESSTTSTPQTKTMWDNIDTPYTDQMTQPTDEK
jgi:hypothetical protein